jgi:hypothetical protein
MQCALHGILELPGQPCGRSKGIAICSRHRTESEFQAPLLSLFAIYNRGGQYQTQRTCL